MRRLIAYIITALAMLLAIGVGATPVITKLNSGREYTSGKSYREIVFNVEKTGDEEKDKDRGTVIAEEMKNRLNDYNVQDYSVKVQTSGEDQTVTVALDMTSKDYNYAAKYLAFSGESFALVSSNGKPESVRAEDKLFNADDVRIEYKGDAKVPVIVIPVTDAGKKDVEDLVNEFKDGDSDSSKAIKRDNLKFDGEEEEESETQNLLYLWANFDEDRNEGYDSLEKDPLSREKVLMAFNADNIWYEDAKKDETALFYMCATADKENQNQLDISGLKDDNARANYLVGMLKANKYEFEITCPTMNITESGIDYYANARVLSASAESILTLGNNVTIKMSKTFIATAIAIVIVSLLLVVYYRLSAVAIIATSLGSLFLTLISFTSMHVLFNIPAVIGFVILYAGTLFGEVIYVNRFKEEVYKGRSLKKANQEASKRANLLTLDSAIVLGFSGLMMYAIGGSALKPMGVVLFFGAIFTLIMNLLVFKLLMYLMTNSSNLQNKYKVFNIEGDKVPNILSSEEKPTYEAPYEKVDFTKKKGVVSIVLGALSAAALACIIVFGVISPTKSPLNVQKAVEDTTVIYAAVKADSESPVIYDGESFVTYALKDTKYAEVKGIAQDVEAKKVSQYEYDSSEDDKTNTYYYFTLNVNEKLDTETLSSIETQIESNLNEFGVAEEDVRVMNSQELIYTPSQGFVALATGISIIGISLYFAFRFRPSRGIAVCAVSTGSALIAYGAIVAMRFIGTTALTSLAMPVVAVTTLLASLFFLSTEKAMLKESNLVLTPELRKETMVKAIGKSASALFVFMLICMYVVINFFGFGVDNTAILFASVLIGDVVGVIALVVLMGPLASVLEKAFSKIHLPKIKWFAKKEKAKQPVKRNSSEPEETIFIGIND